MKNYRGAVIGCGRIGAQMEADPKRIKPATHAGAYRIGPNTELAALVDSDQVQLERALALFPNTPTFPDTEAMLKAVQPDLVSIATLPPLHCPMVELCAKYLVPAILCEKPISENRQDAEAMIQACRKGKSLLFINHIRRFDRVIRSASEEIKNGLIGDIQHGTAYYTAGLFNTASHLVDLMRLFLGDITCVRGFLDKRMSTPPGDLAINGWVMFKRDIPVAIQHLEVKDYSIFDLRLYGRRGAMTINRFGFSIEKTPVRKCYEYSGYQELDIDRVQRQGASRSFMADLVPHMTACLEGRDKPWSSGEDGLATLIVLLALKNSAENDGRCIRIGE